jgi:hypothetical protein
MEIMNTPGNRNPFGLIHVYETRVLSIINFYFNTMA